MSAVIKLLICDFVHYQPPPPPPPPVRVRIYTHTHTHTIILEFLTQYVETYKVLYTNIYA
jgi:hypothetical protein